MIEEDLKYSKEHEWIQLEGDIATIGISKFAQESLGDIVFVELPTIGTQIQKTQELAVIESVKAASEVYSPVGGEVIEVNSTLIDSPENISKDMQHSWIAKIKVANISDLDDLMSYNEYKAFIE